MTDWIAAATASPVYAEAVLLGEALHERLGPAAAGLAARTAEHRDGHPGGGEANTPCTVRSTIDTLELAPALRGGLLDAATHLLLAISNVRLPVPAQPQHQ